MQDKIHNETDAWDAPSGASTDASTPLGNRPAHNARRVDNADAIPRDWRGAENAADFLGLDPDLAAPLSGTPGAARQGAGVAPGAEAANASQSWLFGLAEDPSSEPISQVATRGTRASPPPAAVDEPEESESADADPDADPTGALETSYNEESPRRRLSGLLMPSIAAATLLGLGVMLYKIYSVPEPAPVGTPTLLTPSRPNTRTARTTDEPGRASGPARSAPAVADGGPIDRSRGDDATPRLLEDVSTGAASTSSAAETAFAAEPPAPAPPTQPDANEIAATSAYVADPSRPASERIETWMRVYGRPASPLADIQDGAPDAVSGLPPDVSVHLPHAAGSPYLSSSRADAGGGSPERWSPRGDLGPSTPATDGARATRGPRRATQADLAGVWEGSTVPTEAIEASARLLTPAVGRVRLILNGGETFEGRLYAVGDHKLWLDTSLGRMALLADQVRKIDQLSGPGAAGGGTPNEADLAMLPRVRVRTPGGMLYGKVIARDTATITLITEAGARVTLDSTDVEDAPPGKTTIVHPGGS